MLSSRRPALRFRSVSTLETLLKFNINNGLTYSDHSTFFDAPYDAPGFDPFEYDWSSYVGVLMVVLFSRMTSRLSLWLA